ncbi:Retrovirus-related Pol polyprotein from transposon opus [Thelohanellus kitauei]|uniref:Retrovirus-related Pol polyprotein from transposon opus n=1 Tax=Thelohanellus kitauei TaxID=669202 RepID=A0A0C2MR18_THEKT|nr:Retrovirus-related Pol polyprotein from transposon opus [Thelohanellus kitauei]
MIQSQKRLSISIQGLACTNLTFSRLADTIPSPAFQRMINKVLECIPGCAIYLDDVIIFSENEAGHLKTLQNVFEAINRASLKHNHEKCKLGYSEIEFMGYIVFDRELHENTDS